MQDRDAKVKGSEEAKAYEAPEIKDLGTLEELTLLQNKIYGPTDGYTFNNVPITNT